MFQTLIDDFHLCFVKNGRYDYLLQGLGVTIEVAFSAIATWEGQTPVNMSQ